MSEPDHNRAMVVRHADFTPHDDYAVFVSAFACDHCLGAAESVQLAVPLRAVATARCGTCGRESTVVLTQVQAAHALMLDPWLVTTAAPDLSSDPGPTPEASPTG